MSSKVNKLYFFPRGFPFKTGSLPDSLPDVYKKFYIEWKLSPRSPVHYIPKPGNWELKGNIPVPIQNVPIPLKFPPESNQGLWGGEGVIKGFQRRSRNAEKFAYIVVPKLKRAVLYSEILNKYMSVIVTNRTMNLINENSGFDHYILNTPASDIQSELGVKFKRKLLLALQEKNYYPDNVAKQTQIFEDYNHYLQKYTKEEIEWYGLTVREAIRKLKAQQQISTAPFPLKHKYRSELIQKLIEERVSSQPEEHQEESWLSKVNPFADKKSS